ncbi:MAG: ParM/StbA family protein [Anaerolineae bacterium]|nr:ParM/StbA family protein [Anaerolineae bacterium]
MVSRKFSPNGQHGAVQRDPLLVGLDIGYGRIKAVMPGKKVVFPSVMGRGINIKFRAEEIADRYPGDQLYDEEGTWFVGNLALSQIPPAEILSLRGRTGDEAAISNPFRLLMMKAALGKLLMDTVWDGEQVPVVLSAGLPVDHMPDAPALKEALLGHHQVETDAGRFMVEVTQVMVMPQPYGAYYTRFLTETGAINTQHTAQITGIVDVGHFTTDLIVDNGGEYIDSMSGSVEAGVHTAHERIAALLERKLREKPHPAMVEEALLKGIVRVRGKDLDLSKEVSEALTSLRRATLKLMGEKWQTGARIDAIYLGGGGAQLVAAEVQHAYPHAELIRDAQFANAQGYLNYALFRQREDEAI